MDVSASSEGHPRTSRVEPPPHPALALVPSRGGVPSCAISHNNGNPNELQADGLLIAGERKKVS